MNGKSEGIECSEKDNGVITNDAIWTVEKNTMRGQFKSYFGRKRSLVFRIALLALILLIGILLIIFVCSFNSSILGQLKTINEQGKMCTMCPIGWRTIGSSCYYVSEETRTWNQARDECHKVNSFLAVIKDRNESDSVNTLLNWNRYYWIGLRRDTVDSHIWKWRDGSEVTFTNWGVNEPAYESCGEIFSRAWIARVCFYLANYICEKNQSC
ncbi:C-type lectin lectoxin-Lio3-like isoform X2 [Anomaloglossus baeobatrachus]|uniref:C-type lectin lectoxin-Lio3-like isoform X2 n=1 Tax=Anomaloglossus baeobatrachus TaxID=238106 RepID=UPI003F4F7FEB